MFSKIFSQKTSEDVPKTSKRKSSLRPKTLEMKAEVKEEEDLWKDDLSIDSEPQTDRHKDIKTLEEENSRLSSKLKICMKQKEALLKINKYLDKSLSLMQKIDMIYKNFRSDDNEVQELEDQLNASNDCVKEWKQKYDLIEFNQKMKSLYKTSGNCQQTNWSDI